MADRPMAPASPPSAESDAARRRRLMEWEAELAERQAELDEREQGGDTP